MVEALLAASREPVIAWGLDGRLIAANDAAAQILGHTREELIGQSFADLSHPDERDEAARRQERRRAGDREVEEFVGRLWTANRRVVRVRGRSVPVVDGDRVVADVLTFWLIDTQIAPLGSGEADYEVIFERITDAVYTLDRRGGIAWMNRAAEHLFGRSLAEMRRVPRSEFLFPEGEAGQDTIRQRFSSGDAVPQTIRFRFRRPDGEERWVQGSLLMVRDHLGAHSHSIIIARDVTEERQRARALREQAERAREEALLDAVTGLPNRRAFDLDMETTKTRFRVGQPASLLLMDLDRLKAINDTMGHAGGDEALRAVAQALTERTRADDRVFRIGGDEFAVITATEDASPLAQRLRAPIHFRDPELWLTVSVGFAAWGEADDAFALADERMYQMKRNRHEGGEAEQQPE
jgi:diguanylate cyclase (GGDEF)-like protein/PAS domain S-box-containing protein